MKQPDGEEFVKKYLAMDKPGSSHIYYSRGILDFLLGMAVGIVIGLVLARVV